jgi:hypothetical protein
MNFFIFMMVNPYDPGRPAQRLPAHIPVEFGEARQYTTAQSIFPVARIEKKQPLYRASLT